MAAVLLETLSGLKSALVLGAPPSVSRPPLAVATETRVPAAVGAVDAVSKSRHNFLKRLFRSSNYSKKKNDLKNS